MDVRKWVEQQMYEAHKECPHNYIPDDAGCPLCIRDQIVPAITKLVKALLVSGQRLHSSHNANPKLYFEACPHHHCIEVCATLAELEKP